MEAPDKPIALPATGPWELPVDGYEVIHITFSFLIDIVTYGETGSDSVGIRLEGRFDYTDADGSVHELDISNQPWEELALLLSLRADRLKTLTASTDAQLDATFASGRALSAGSDPHYENWEVWGPGYRLIALPEGGEAAVALLDESR